jgi:methylthioribose-1-phosphate isomerase
VRRTIDWDGDAVTIIDQTALPLLVKLAVVGRCRGNGAELITALVTEHGRHRPRRVRSSRGG